MPVCISTVSRSTRPRSSARRSRPPALIARQSQIAQVLQCAEVVGILDTVLDFTIQWGFDRHSFGRPLGSYQALKHKYADLKIWFEACTRDDERGGGRGGLAFARRRDGGQRREILCG